MWSEEDNYWLKKTQPTRDWLETKFTLPHLFAPGSSCCAPSASWSSTRTNSASCSALLSACCTAAFSFSCWAAVHEAASSCRSSDWARAKAICRRPPCRSRAAGAPLSIEKGTNQKRNQEIQRKLEEYFSPASYSLPHTKILFVRLYTSPCSPRISTVSKCSTHAKESNNNYSQCLIKYTFRIAKMESDRMVFKTKIILPIM